MGTGDLGRRIAAIDAGYDSYAQEEEIFAAAGARLEVFPGGRHDRRGKMAFAAGACGLLVRWTVVDEEFLRALPGLRAIVRYGVGHENIDLDAAARLGIRVSNVQGYANHSVSDHALGLMLACARGFRAGTEIRQLRGHYGNAPSAFVPELRETTLGIVGLGRIGGTLCVKARGLFRRILACDPYIAEERFRTLGAIPCAFDRILEESDVLSLHCALTEETRLLVGERALDRLRPTAILINTSRGPVVDEEALLRALEGGRLHAAGLDVFWDEPPLENRDALLAHPRVVATGHYAWYSGSSIRELQRRAAENMAAMLRGEIPEDCLNP
ncbi:MAG: C-terminal binding protein [Planctomycetes bacterium]|nr:C-terminal binding protein [Planctomycetota bacterium]